MAHSELSKTSKMELLAKIVDGFHSRPQYYHRTLYDVLQQIELTKGTSPSQRTQLLGVKLKKFFTSYRHLKTQMHSVSTGFPPLFFINILKENLLMQVFYIQNRKMCLSKMIIYQYSAAFLPCLGQLLLRLHFICHYLGLKS